MRSLKCCQNYNNKGEKDQMPIMIRYFSHNPASATYTLTYIILAGEPGSAANWAPSHEICLDIILFVKEIRGEKTKTEKFKRL
jgi:hypothetical protein